MDSFLGFKCKDDFGFKEDWMEGWQEAERAYLKAVNEAIKEEEEKLKGLGLL